MLTTRTPAPTARRSLAGALLVVLTLAACSSAGAGPSPSAAPPGGTPQPTPTAVPGASGTTGGGGGGGGGVIVHPGTGGGTGGNPGSGIVPPGVIFPVDPGPDQGLLGDARYLTPTAGLIDQRNVNVQLVRAAIADDGHVFADLRWWSGVAPCNQLDSVKVVRDDAAKTMHLVVVEGSAPGDMMCIEIAELHATAVDLGVLDAGKWTISAEGDAPAITLEVQ